MRIGYTVIEVLHFLRGHSWDEIARAYLHALRPSEVRVIAHDAPTKTDAVVWRVTTYLDVDGAIDRIVQEVEVELPDGVAHGFDLDERRRGRPTSSGHAVLIRYPGSVRYTDGI